MNVEPDRPRGKTLDSGKIAELFKIDTAVYRCLPLRMREVLNERIGS